MALFSFLNAGWFANLFDSTPTPPIEVPINLSKAGSEIDIDIRVKERGAYYFSLEFLSSDEVKNGIRDFDIAHKISGCNSYDPSTGKQLRICDYESAKNLLGSLIDEEYNPDGTTIPLKLTLFQIIDNDIKRLIKDKTYQTKGGYSGTRDFEMLLLTKGKYNIKIENIQNILEMKNREANFRFARHGHK